MARDTIDQLARMLAESVPQGLRSMRDDLEHNFRSVLRSGLGRLDPVTRDEFEVQEAVLARTRARLEALEGRLAALETVPAVEAPKPPAAKPAKKKKKKPATKKKAAKTRKKTAAKKAD